MWDVKVPPPRLGNTPPSSLDSSSERGNRPRTRFLSIAFAEPSLFYVLLGSRPDVTITLSRCRPPRYCGFLEGLVVDDGIKPLGLHLRATCRGVVLLIFGSICFRPSYYYVYRQSHPYKIMYYLCLLTLSGKGGVVVRECADRMNYD